MKSYAWGTDLSGSMEGAGAVGGLLWQTTSTQTHFTAYDGNGNVAALVDSDTGDVTATYEYGPFGQVLEKQGAYATDNAFRFSTKWEDAETGLNYYGFRYYNPATGRWLSRDPIGEIGFNENEATEKRITASSINTTNDKRVIDDVVKFMPKLVHKSKDFSYTTRNLYLFLNNAPAVAYDYLGLDITLETGNNSGRILNDVLHQNVCVDFGGTLPKICFSFAATGAGIHVGRTWLGWSSWKCAILEGEIYSPNPVPGATIASRHITTLTQDSNWLRYMSGRVGMVDAYSVARNNCRKYAQWEFRDAPLHW